MTRIAIAVTLAACVGGLLLSASVPADPLPERSGLPRSDAREPRQEDSQDARTPSPAVDGAEGFRHPSCTIKRVLNVEGELVMRRVCF